jgi:hypothetical protein
LKEEAHKVNFGVIAETLFGIFYCILVTYCIHERISDCSHRQLTFYLLLGINLKQSLTMCAAELGEIAHLNQGICQSIHGGNAEIEVLVILEAIRIDLLHRLHLLLWYIEPW